MISHLSGSIFCTVNVANSAPNEFVLINCCKNKLHFPNASLYSSMLSIICICGKGYIPYLLSKCTFRIRYWRMASAWQFPYTITTSLLNILCGIKFSNSLYPSFCKYFLIS